MGFGIPELAFCLPVMCHVTHGKSPNLCPAHMTYPMMSVSSRPQIRAPDFWTCTSFVMVYIISQVLKTLHLTFHSLVSGFKSNDVFKYCKA